MIDQWPAHVEAMKAGGLHVVTPDGELHTPVRAYHLCEACSLNPRFDVVLLAAKSYDSCWMVEFIKQYLKPDGVVVSVQNSLNDEWIAPIVGITRDIGCVIDLSAEIFTPGTVQRNTTRAKTWFGLGAGEFIGSTDEVLEKNLKKHRRRCRKARARCRDPGLPQGAMQRGGLSERPRGEKRAGRPMCLRPRTRRSSGSTGRSSLER